MWMRDGRFGGLIVVGLIAWALPASSALADTNHGTVAGVEYISDTANPAENPGKATAEAECEGTDEALGGGYKGPFTVAENWESAITPFDGADDASRPDDGYRIKYFNSTPLDDLDATVWTICSAALKSYTEDSARLGGHATKKISVKCPAGQQVTGGGGAVSGGIGKAIVQSTYPFDDGDVGTTPEDGWRVRVHNLGAGEKMATVTAVCEFTGSTYVSDSVPVDAGFSVGSPIACGATDVVLSGGARVPGPPRKARLSENYPGDNNGDGDSVPDDWWIVGVKNATDHQLTYKRFVICRD